jgi:multidrug efflux system outer membrane protein
VAYIEVVDANRDTLTAEEANAALTGQRLIAAVQLIKALGGGWTDEQILASAGPVTVQSAMAREK